MELPFAFLISPLERVVRSDGTRILVSEKLTFKEEFKLIRFTMTSKLILLSALWAVWSFFYSGTWSTYLGIYFSVRSRALSSLISPFFCIVGCFGLGFILDIKSLSQRRRAQLGLFVVVILNLGVYIWSIIMQAKFNTTNPGKIDWDEPLYASSFLPYFFVQTTGPLSQSYMYWLLSSFATDAQSNVRNGAAFSCVTLALMAASVGPMLVLVNATPDRIPADVILETQEVQQEKKLEELKAEV
ncbi:hypothetical protein Daesc_006026 [Daldinia eschscholtzii]|uniref:Uncharacterized protein n=1 Tax=Daldinia eschscholtzii TaxID=292717 RepID=A0AAX6MFX3_9PEZI